ncbi:MAG: alpha/beta hydrolase family protein [Candidatus Thorarchaeota archaeon]
MEYGAVQDRAFTEDVDQYQHIRRENMQLVTYLKKFPLVPESLEITYVDLWDFHSFNLHKIQYSVEPFLSIFAYLLMPKNLKTRVPGILALHEHNDEYKAGKSETIGLVQNPEYTKLEAVAPNPKHVTPESRRQFAYAKDLCEQGFVVLAPDFIGFEEYRAVSDYYDEPGFLRGYEEMLSSKYLLYGSCLLAKHLHDLYVAVSVLASIDNVDSDKLGVIGHSLGGEMASILAAFDSRIKAGAVSCGFVSYEAYEKSGRMETAESIIPNFRADNLDFDFFLKMIPPTPFLLTQDARDTVKLPHDTWKKLMVFEHQNGHSFPEAARKRAYDFLTDTLKS